MGKHLGARQSFLLCLLALVSGCDGSSSAPGVPPDADSGTIETDAAPPEPINCAESMGAQDADGDGFSRAKNDCDDCNMAIGPGALDVPGNGVDEDCSGMDAPMAPPPCDGELEPDAQEAESAARVLGVCESHSKNSRLPGLIEAQWENLAGENAPLIDPKQVWLPTKFGTMPAREGQRLLVLSTGVARDVNDDDYTPDCDRFNATRGPEGAWTGASEPPGDYPRDSSQCPKGSGSENALGYNEVVLSLTLRAPTNVKSLEFDSLFLTYEYPDFVCSKFNDFFVVLMGDPPSALKNDDFELAGDKVANILFDSEGDPIGVNSGLLAVCEKAARGRVARPIECQQGPALLADTGFDRDESICASKLTSQPDIGGASTGWLYTSVPVKPGEVFTLRFMLWDSGDPLLDSTVLIDNFRWSLQEQDIITGPISGG
jgi:hypothetical protein